ncbi:hypothetical protein [uncultured Mediterranean phage]|nr:hypothetical protein [uncultured Mediterranean phage]
MGVVYKINGKAVSRSKFNKNPKGAGNIIRSWESRLVIKCDGSGVHPGDREEAMAHAKKHGVPTYFDEQGRAHYTSLRHQTDHLRTIGFHNKDGIH